MHLVTLYDMQKNRYNSPRQVIGTSQRDLYPTTHNTHKRKNIHPEVGFEPAILESERALTYALDGGATGTGFIKYPKV